MKLLTALLTVVLPVLAQDPTSSLDGTVTNAKTGEPISRAMVRVMRFGPLQQEVQQPGPGRLTAEKPFSRREFTDAGGVFHFTGLPTGQYFVSAQKPQFTLDSVDGGAGEIPVELTGTTETLSVKLSPLGVISGTITDQDGLPVRGVNVMALSTQIQDGLRQFKSDRSVATDDLGNYRFWNLTPGRYYIKAAGISGGTVQYVGDTAPGLGDESFAPVYFGGARTLESAAALEIGAGADARADFRLVVESAFRVRGSIANFVPRRPVGFELLSGAEDVSSTRVTLNSDTGRFEVASVVPGSFILRATQDDSTAEAPVTVRSGDIEGVTLAMAPPGNVRVTVHFTNAPRGSQLKGTGFCNPLLLPIGRPGGPRFLFPPPAMRPGEETIISGLGPGKYNFSIQCPGGYARSATAGAQDLATNPILTVPAGVSPPPVEIVASYGGGSIHGYLKLATPAGLKYPTILLLPQFPSPAGPQATQTFPDEKSPDSFRFLYAGLAPGSYTVSAFSSSEIEYRNPEFVRALTGGTLIQIDGDETKEVTISGVVH